MDFPLMSDSPKSPRSMLPRARKYWTRIGSFKPILSLSASTASFEA